MINPEHPQTNKHNFSSDPQPTDSIDDRPRSYEDEDPIHSMAAEFLAKNNTVMNPAERKEYELQRSQFAVALTRQAPEAMPLRIAYVNDKMSEIDEGEDETVRGLSKEEAAKYVQEWEAEANRAFDASANGDDAADFKLGEAAEREYQEALRRWQEENAGNPIGLVMAEASALTMGSFRNEKCTIEPGSGCEAVGTGGIMKKLAIDNGQGFPVGDKKGWVNTLTDWGHIIDVHPDSSAAPRYKSEADAIIDLYQQGQAARAERKAASA